MEPEPAGLTDEIVQAAVGGSRPDVDRIIVAVAGRVPAMVATRLSPMPHQWGAVDDIAQNVLLGLTKALPGLEHPTVAGLRALLSGIATRQVARFLERGPDGAQPQPIMRSLDSTVASFSQSAAVGELLTGSRPSPRTALERAEQIQHVLAGLGSLKPADRELITLAIIDQMPLRLIAAQTNTTRDAAAMRLVRAVRTLRRNITGSSTAGAGA